MTDIDFPAWRRELEQAIARGETIPIRVLLDQAEAAVADLEAEAAEIQGMFTNPEPSDAPEATT
jgi:hypothetical protein